jgi:hypothetical protein
VVLPPPVYSVEMIKGDKRETKKFDKDSE